MIVNTIWKSKTGNGILMLCIIRRVHGDMDNDKFDREDELQMLKEVDSISIQNSDRERFALIAKCEYIRKM